MRAYVLRSYGGPDRAELRDVELPQPAPGEIRVRVEAAGLNPVDYKIRNGMLRAVQGYRFPVVLGNELAGVVDACGEGVTRYAPGDRVFARVEKHRLGAFAEFACVGEAVAARAVEHRCGACRRSPARRPDRAAGPARTAARPRRHAAARRRWRRRRRHLRDPARETPRRTRDDDGLGAR
jgi:threonine dehydrogenase-like Zn-dependent dehydrogenase